MGLTGKTHMTLQVCKAKEHTDESFAGRIGTRNFCFQKNPHISRILWHYNPKYCPFGCVFQYRIHQIFQKDFYACEHTRNFKKEHEAQVREGELYRAKYLTEEPLVLKFEATHSTNSSFFSAKKFISQTVNLDATVHHSTFTASRILSYSPTINIRSNQSNYPILGTFNRFPSGGTTQTSVFLGGREDNFITPSFIDIYCPRRDFIQNSNTCGSMWNTPATDCQSNEGQINHTGETYASICRGSAPENSVKPAVHGETILVREVSAFFAKPPMQDLSRGENAGLLGETVAGNRRNSSFPQISHFHHEKVFDHLAYSAKQEQLAGGGPNCKSLAETGQSLNFKLNFPESNRKLFCPFCKNSGKPNDVVTSHVMKDKSGKNVCPYLRRIVCPLCRNQNEDNAHTMKYCPLYRDQMLDEAIRRNRQT